MKDFKAYIVRELPDGSFVGEIKERSISDLPYGDLLIKVAFSSLNYKDALSASGNKGISPHYPHVPGIDAAGTIIESASDNYEAGDKVIVTGYELGMSVDGGFETYIRIPAEWAIPLPEGMSFREAMSYGTAGFTAAQCVEKITSLIQPDDGPILVSGATGGVGSFSVAILSKLGYQVIATTGKKDTEEYLRKLGAQRIETREKWDISTTPFMLKCVLAGAVDTVGGRQLENIIKSVNVHGAITCCGMVSSPQLSITVYPFILRGITLFGISSQHARPVTRMRLWKKLHNEYAVNNLADKGKEISLKELPEVINNMLAGKIKGHYRIRISER